MAFKSPQPPFAKGGQGGFSSFVGTPSGHGHYVKNKGVRVNKHPQRMGYYKEKKENP